jgi:hypothetical protein
MLVYSRVLSLSPESPTANRLPGSHHEEVESVVTHRVRAFPLFPVASYPCFTASDRTVRITLTIRHAATRAPRGIGGGAAVVRPTEYNPA